MSIAKRYMNRGIPLPDLVTEGNLGLYEAARRFDERKGCRVHLLRGLVDSSQPEQGPGGSAAPRALPAQPSRHASQRVPRGGVPREEARAGAFAGRGGQGDRQAPGRDPGGHGFRAGVSRSSRTTRRPDREAPLNRIADQLGRHLAPRRAGRLWSADSDVREAVESLNQREELIINLYFGLTGEEPYTLGEIGEKLHLSKERIRQLKDRALHRLRTSPGHRRLEAHLN